jgi:hypothetical protein
MTDPLCAKPGASTAKMYRIGRLVERITPVAKEPVSDPIFATDAA